jgi:D-xylose transport system substrate-binding protein
MGLQHKIGQQSGGLRKGSRLTVVAAGALLAAACGSSSTGSSGTSAISNPGVPSTLSVSSFTTDIAGTMGTLKTLTNYATKGGEASLLIGVILPDTTSSTRWVDFDQPYLNDALADAGFKGSEYRIDNAQGSDAVELNDATADINLGAKVLIMCPLDGPTGVAIAQAAAKAGVTLISYDRATFQGSQTYYVSFDNEAVGEAIGNGFLACVTAWNVKSPQVFVLNGGEDTDPNAISFADGYNKVVWGTSAKTVAAGTTNSQGMTLVGENYAPGWSNTQGGTIYQQEFTSHPSINATIEANDGLGSAVVSDLKAAGVKAKTIPVTGQDATAQGMAYILSGYQCGSVYKPVYKEAQDAVAMAIVLLSGNKVPAALLNGKTTDPADSTITEPASLLTATWVNAANMESTVVKDGFDPASAICALATAAECSAAGIS